MTFDKILCPIDFSPGSQQAMRVAARIARDTGCELVLAHAWYLPPTAYTFESPFPPYVVNGIVRDAERGLDDVVKEAKAAGVKRVTSKLLTGVPWAKIVEELETERYDLCVIGTHGRTGLARVLLGSVAEKVVRHAPCSVLTVRPDASLEPFRHALVPTDFSDSASAALELATKLVAATGSLALFHVIEVLAVYAGEAPVADFARDIDQRVSAELDKQAERVRRATGLNVTASSSIGYPGAQILAALDDDRRVDLVVVGSHGRTGLTRMLTGSVAEKVVRHARCPVLVARTRA
jgi:nucleotide-binding universal stress UspA family protein